MPADLFRPACGYTLGSSLAWLDDGRIFNRTASELISACSASFARQGSPACRLGRVPPAVRSRLIGDARVMCAVGQARERLAAAEVEIGSGRIADGPVAGPLAQFQKRQALAQRHDIVIGDRIARRLNLEGLRERGVAA